MSWWSEFEGAHWSEVFGRSTLGVAVWVDRHYLGRWPGLPEERCGGGYRVFRSSTSQVYADGGWVSEWSEYPIGAEGLGTRIYGWATLRLLCIRYRLVPPNRRLKGEPFVPDPDILSETVVEPYVTADDLGPDTPFAVWEGRRIDPRERGSLTDRAVWFWKRLAAAHRAAGLDVPEGLVHPNGKVEPW